MKIQNLTVKKSDKVIINDLSVDFSTGKIHAIMGPNGCGKTTLSNTIVKHPDCHIEQGRIMFKNKELNHLDIEMIALEGVYLAPQYPIVINGLSHAAFIKEALNAKRKHQGQNPIDEFEFIKILKSKAQEFGFNSKEYIKHSLNFGYSGGEKKKNEMIQISMLSPDFIILDEIDSGLDIEAIKKVVEFIKNYMKPDVTVLAITHHPSFAKSLNADFVHIMKAGKIVKTGSLDLVDIVEKNGFGEF